MKKPNILILIILVTVCILPINSIHLHFNNMRSVIVDESWLVNGPIVHQMINNHHWFDLFKELLLPVYILSIGQAAGISILEGLMIGSIFLWTDFYNSLKKERENEEHK